MKYEITFFDLIRQAYTICHMIELLFAFMRRNTTWNFIQLNTATIIVFIWYDLW